MANLVDDQSRNVNLISQFVHGAETLLQDCLQRGSSFSIELANYLPIVSAKSR